MSSSRPPTHSNLCRIKDCTVLAANRFQLLSSFLAFRSSSQFGNHRHSDATKRGWMMGSFARKREERLGLRCFGMEEARG